MTPQELLAQIRAEIEKRIEEYDVSIEKYAKKEKSIKAERDAWKWAELKSLLRFLDTLAVDAPEGLDEAARNYTEDYVSLETAKLLKEKGFDEGCRQYWYKGNIVFSRSEIRNRELDNYEEEGWTAPTLQAATKWLRERYNIHIEPRFFPMPDIYRYVIIHSPMTIENIDSHPQYFNTYEETCEAAIKHCLENLI